MPIPRVSSTSGNIGYFGHEMWVGPQSAWWTQQTVNAERLAAKSVWPPDPFLVLSRHTIKQQNDAQILLQGPDSPISGIAFTKHYQLVKEQRSEEHTSELQSRENLVCRLLLEKKNKKT